jgi:hypothetical protein
VVGPRKYGGDEMILAWSGWIVAMCQFVWFVYDLMRKKSNRSNLVAIRDSLRSIREMGSDALERKEPINNEPAQQWVRQLQLAVKDAEGRLEDAIGIRKSQT